MTYEEAVQKFLGKVEEIKRENPAYKQPGDGSNGLCDCIGLLIGAVRRMGLKYTGIHGSNYAARYQTVELKPIYSEDDLELGDVVYKACEKGSQKHKWDLPERYWSGKQYYNGDMHDYYHVGVVTSVNPLNITHMTSPQMRIDTKLDQNRNSVWNYHGKFKPVYKASDGKQESTETKPQVNPDIIPNTGSQAIVVADNGLPVKMRQYPSKDCRTWDKVPCGTKAVITDPGEPWAKINCGRRKGWYMMSRYLDVIGDGKGKY